MADSANAFLTTRANDRAMSLFPSRASLPLSLIEQLMVGLLRQICFRLSLIAFALCVAFGAAYAQDGSALTPDAADGRDAPTPVFADGTPGQYVLTGNQDRK